ncbi:MAG: DUF2007 domain-containing protein [Bacteroidia bacterium]|nr:DUF2007 domain-containing protein [Bacteroidia bacterium]
MTEKSPKPEAHFALLFSSNKLLEIEAAVALLDEQGIASYKIDKKDSSYIFGEVELYVSEENLVRAQLILTENDLL